MKRKYGVLFCLMILSLLFSTNINAATRTVILRKNKTVTVYAVKSDKWRLKAVKKLKWISSKKKVATVKASIATGIVKPVSVGTTIIQGKNGKTKYTCKFIVEAPKINKKTLKLDVGKTSTLSISKTKQKIKWTSSNNSVCTVSNTGTVKAIKPGSATVTANVGKYLKYHCKITVSKKVEVLVDKYHVQHVEFDYYKDEYSNDINYYGIVTIHNDGNTNLYLKDCIFDIEETNGHLITTESTVYNCPDVLRPGENGYFYTPFGGTIKNISENTKLQLSITPDIKQATGTTDRYPVSDVSLRQNNYGSYSVTGRVTNNTNKDDSYLYINSVYLDENGNAVGANGVSVLDLYAGSTKSFEITSMAGSRKVKNKEFKKYIVIAEKSYFQY